MNTLDYILLIPLIPAVISGIRKGFLVQAISIIAIVLGVWLSCKFSQVVSDWVRTWFDGPEGAINAIAFTLIFIGVALALGALARILEKSLKLVMLGCLNRLLGVIFAIAKYLLVIGIIVLIFNGINTKFGIVKSDILSESAVYQTIKDFALQVFPYLKELLFSK